MSSLPLDNLTIKFENKSLGPWKHPYYPIFLNQGNDEKVRELVVNFHILQAGKLCRKPEDYRIEALLRYGQSPIAVPQPKHGYKGGLTRAPARKVLEQLSLDHGARWSTIRLKPHPDCLSEAGFECTVRLRLLLMHPTENVVLAFCDSDRFVIMTRDLPSDQRMHTYLAEWGFPIHPEDTNTRTNLDKLNEGRRRKAPEPAAYLHDDEEVETPDYIQLPSGETVPTIHGLRNAHRLMDLSAKLNLFNVPLAPASAPSSARPGEMNGLPPALPMSMMPLTRNNSGSRVFTGNSPPALPSYLQHDSVNHPFLQASPSPGLMLQPTPSLTALDHNQLPVSGNKRKYSGPQSFSFPSSYPFPGVTGLKGFTPINAQATAHIWPGVGPSPTSHSPSAGNGATEMSWAAAVSASRANSAAKRRAGK